MDWRIATVAGMFLLGVYNFLVRKFFVDQEDWRALIPLLVFGVAALAVYFAFSFKDVKFSVNTLYYGLAIGAVGLGMVFCVLSAMSNPNAQMVFVIPVLALSTVVTVGLAVLFLSEQLTLTKIAGIVLSLVALALVAIE